ncbi:MAG: hypothetical protein NT001_04430, partial [Candidatus Woesearchaeota archaeon]|nr:hypothetical protein [Candidatus Woesearchaeota archaeon]
IKRGRIGIAPLKRLMMSGLVIAVIAMIVFTIVAPNLTFSMTKWVSGVIYDSQRRSGFAGLEATNGMSLMGKEARIFSNLSWGFGYPLMIASVLSLLYMCYRRKKEDLLIAPFIVVYFAFMATYPVFVVWYGTFMFPFLAIAIGSLFDSSLSALTERWQRMLVYAVLILIFIYSLLYTLAFMNIMAGEDVRVTAGNWMDQNLPPGTQINFGPGINPWMMPVVDLSKYNISSTPEYIIISKAAYYNIVRLIENPSIYQPSDWAGKMPSQQEMMFYDMIYHEKGPYKLAEDVKKTPEFMGFKINDDNAPYTVWAITHPEIRIYKLQASGANETG